MIAAYHPVPAIAAIALCAGIVLGVAAKATRRVPTIPVKHTQTAAKPPEHSAEIPLNVPADVLLLAEQWKQTGFGARWPSIDLMVEAAGPIGPKEGPTDKTDRTPDRMDRMRTQLPRDVCEAHGRRKVWLPRHRWRCLK
jgi:hypothetical protein